MVRVYELGKELEMTNSKLIVELEKLGILVKSHMSSIKEGDLPRIRSRLSTNKTHEVTEKRVKATIIRRRIKKVVPEVKPVETKVKVGKLPEVEKAPQEKEGREPSVDKERPYPLAAPEKVVEKKEGPVKDVERIEAEHGKDVSKPAPITARQGEDRKPLKEPVEAKPDKVTPGKPKKKEVKAAVEDRLPKKVAYKKQGGRTKGFYGRGKNRRVPTRLRGEKKEHPRKVERKTEITVSKAIKRKIKILETVTVGDLAKRMGVKVGEVIKKLLDLGMAATINHPLDIDTASLVAGEFSYVIESTSFEEEILGRREDAPEELVQRPPVVTVMGHVDHGKTSLLDAIRRTNVMGTEAGGITQHMGAYRVSLPKGDVVFLDTPGHEAFTAMRARGAHVTDIVILVVAADDGVMSQTIEAINHAKAAGVTLMVAINKIDKPNADVERVRASLMEYELVPEQLGGDTIFVEVSAKKKQGINDLLELVLLQAEMLELKANPNKPARGVVIEAKLDKGRGPVATVLVQEGTLKTGDPFVVGSTFGKIRTLINEGGEKTAQAGPAMPIEVVGLSGVPEAGDGLVVIDDEKKARQVSMFRQQKKREAGLVRTRKITLEELHDRIQEGEVKELNTIIKADVQGSIDALLKALHDLDTDSIKVNVIHTSVGTVVESDVMLASASDAIIIGFNVKPDPKVRQVAEQEKVSIRTYSIIYDMISDVRKAMEGLLEPVFNEKVLGRAEVRDTFKIS